jgi:hypothetical protein
MRRPDSATATLLACLLAPFAAATLGACEVEDDFDPVGPSSSGTAGAGGQSQDGGAGGAVGGAGGAAGGEGGAQCEGTFGPPQDPSTLPSCCSEHGDSHCVEMVPQKFIDNEVFQACEGGGYCVPDVVIAAGDAFEPPPCTSTVVEPGVEGVCLSACLVEVGKNAELLKVDGCLPSERCAPCVHPLTMQPTGSCALFECDGGPPPPPPCDDPETCVYDCAEPAVDPTTLPACPAQWCPGAAHCVQAALVSAEEKELLRGCDDAATSYCVPDEAIETEGNFVAASCDSLSGFEGRCLSLCLPDIAAQADSLPQGTCPETHRCAPCYDPFTGVDSGACAISCDPGPAEPPATFPTCCMAGGTDIGHCVPSAAVPPEDATNFGQEACAADNLCVPDVFGIGPFCPQAPTGSPFQTGELCTTSALAQLLGGASAEGVCLPSCMPEVAAAPAVVGQEGCSADHKCVPCAQNGAPTGACEPMAECGGGS